MWDFGMSTLQWVNTGVPTLTQAHYRWRLDNGSETEASYLADEDTVPTSRIYRGDRVRLRMLISNTGNGTARNNVMRLEYSSSTCTVWQTVPTTEEGDAEWVLDLSQHLQNGVSSANVAGLSDPAGKSFVTGRINTSLNAANWYSVTLGKTHFTEYEYALRSTSHAERGISYCFRLTNNGSLTYFNYSVTPELALSETFRPQSGGHGSIEPDGVGPVITGGDSGGGGSPAVEPEEVGVGPIITGGGGGGGGDSE